MLAANAFGWIPPGDIALVRTGFLRGSMQPSGTLSILGGRALKNFVWDFGAPVGKWGWGALTETWQPDRPQE